MLIDKFLGNLSIPVIVAFVISGVSLLIYAVVKISGIVIKRKLRPLSEIFNAEIKSSFFGGTYLKILNYGPEIRLKLTLGGKDSPSVLSLEVLAPLGFNLNIVRKQVINQIFFRRGAEVKLGDAALDEEFLIRSDKPEEASSYLLNSRRLDAIKYFFGNNFSEIKANAKGLYVNKINYSESDLVTEKVGEYLNNLNNFARM
jgi:hypothetical protein